MSNIESGEIIRPPRLKLLEIGLLMQLDSSTSTFSVIPKKNILPYTRELTRCGYSVGFYTFPDRKESEGKYILEVKKNAPRS